MIFAQTLKILIFSLHVLQVIQRFFVCVLEFEELSAERASFFLGTFQLSLGLLILLLPLRKDLVVLLVIISLLCINLIIYCWYVAF